jgi:hypothetical protein
MRIQRIGQYILVLLTIVAACDDSSGPTTPQGQELAVVVSSSDRLLTVFPVDSPQGAFAIGLGAAGSPVTVAARKQFAVVPLGTFPAAAVVDLAQRRVAFTVPLPAGSGATGVGFVNDSIALVANSSLNSVTPINVLRGTASAAIAVGNYPQAIVSSGDTAYVLNGELGPNFQPLGPGKVSVIAGNPLRVVGTVNLTGNNTLAGVIGRDGFLYVVNAGAFGQANGSLSVVDRRTMVETRRDAGFGEFPGAIAVGTDGRLFVAAFGYGVAIYDPASRTFVQTPTTAIKPGGIAGASGVGVDSSGRIYTLKPECRNPSSIFRLTASLAIEREIPVGICPIGIAFTRFTAP